MMEPAQKKLKTKQSCQETFTDTCGNIYEGEIHKDGSKNTYPWQIVGCDEIIANKGIEVLKKIDMDVIE